jgi:hypothetical protein
MKPHQADEASSTNRGFWLRAHSFCESRGRAADLGGCSASGFFTCGAESWGRGFGDCTFDSADSSPPHLGSLSHTGGLSATDGDSLRDESDA